MANARFHQLLEYTRPLNLAVSATEADSLVTLAAATPGRRLRVFGVRQAGLSALFTSTVEWEALPGPIRVAKTTSVLNSPSQIMWTPHYIECDAIQATPTGGTTALEVYFLEVPE